MARAKREGPRPKRDLITVDLVGGELVQLDEVVGHLNKQRLDPDHFRVRRFTRSEVMRLALDCLSWQMRQGNVILEEAGDGEVRVRLGEGYF